MLQLLRIIHSAEVTHCLLKERNAEPGLSFNLHAPSTWANGESEYGHGWCSEKLESMSPVSLVFLLVLKQPAGLRTKAKFSPQLKDPLCFE